MAEPQSNVLGGFVVPALERLYGASALRVQSHGPGLWPIVAGRQVNRTVPEPRSQFAKDGAPVPAFGGSAPQSTLPLRRGTVLGLGHSHGAAWRCNLRSIAWIQCPRRSSRVLVMKDHRLQSDLGAGPLRWQLGVWQRPSNHVGNKCFWGNPAVRAASFAAALYGTVDHGRQHGVGESAHLGFIVDGGIGRWCAQVGDEESGEYVGHPTHLL